MPEISSFYGIIIKCILTTIHHRIFMPNMEHEALLNINTLGIIAGSLPPKALGLVTEWATIYKDNLLVVWEKAKNLEPLEKIPPLK